MIKELRMYSRSFPDRSQMPKNYSGTLYRSEESEQKYQKPNKTEEPRPDVCKAGKRLETEDLLLIGIALLLMSGDGENDLILLLALLFAIGIF